MCGPDLEEWVSMLVGVTLIELGILKIKHKMLVTLTHSLSSCTISFVTGRHFQALKLLVVNFKH